MGYQWIVIAARLMVIKKKLGSLTLAVYSELR
jgi:hypothetical protein